MSDELRLSLRPREAAKAPREAAKATPEDQKEAGFNTIDLSQVKIESAAGGDPAKTDSAKADSANPEPTKTEPAKTE